MTTNNALDTGWMDELDAAPPPPEPSAAPKIDVAALIESAEIMKRALVDSQRAYDEETAPMRAKLAETEDFLRKVALDTGEPVRGKHLRVQIVKGGETVKWNDSALFAAVNMLPAQTRDALLAHRKVEPKPATTRIVYEG